MTSSSSRRDGKTTIFDESLMATYFISDLHLAPNRPELACALANFMARQSSQMDTLYILGDLFDAWIGDDYENVFTQEIKQLLRSASEAGTELFLMRGNRDFLIGQDFAQQTGCQLLDDPTVIDLYGSRVLLMHGDLLCTQDVDYQKFRLMVRDPQWQQQLLDKPLPERLSIAEQLRSISKEHTGGKEYQIMDVHQPEVENRMLSEQVQVLIHGHTHRPASHKMTLNNAPATRIVLGDWGHELWYLRVDEAGYEIKNSPIVT